MMREKLETATALDHAVTSIALRFQDEIRHYIAKADLPYFDAMMQCIADNPRQFRNDGYSIRGIVFDGFESNPRTGRLVRCKARFEAGEGEACE